MLPHFEGVIDEYLLGAAFFALLVAREPARLFHLIVSYMHISRIIEELYGLIIKLEYVGVSARISWAIRIRPIGVLGDIPVFARHK